jgi:hypothetical protein
VLKKLFLGLSSCKKGFNQQELEHCIHRCGTLLASSAFSLQRLRHTCCRLRNKLRRRNVQLAEKRMHLAQLVRLLLLYDTGIFLGKGMGCANKYVFVK